MEQTTLDSVPVLNESIGPQSPSNLSAKAISETYLDCIQLCRRLLYSLGDQSCRVIHLKQVSLERVLDEYGRLQVWGEQARAVLPQYARGSLDDILRNDHNLKEVVNGMLSQLHRCLLAGRFSKFFKSVALTRYSCAYCRETL